MPGNFRLGETTAADLDERPLRDYIPRQFHDQLDRFIVGQTGGTTGSGIWTAYRDDEFEAAFVTPYRIAASHVGFPREENWLFVGPSGPHVIGKVVHHLARVMGSPDPFSVDFDPRWARRLPEGSFARTRYVDHVVAQAMAIIERQAIGVLFTTPAMLGHLGESMSDGERNRVRGVHYGGMAISPGNLLDFQENRFPRAVHLSGYGNTLFGCCLELSTRPGRDLAYFPCGDRLYLEVVDDDGASLPTGLAGRVRFTRLDESTLIVRMRERDAAESVGPPDDAPEGFTGPGLKNPHVPKDDAPQMAGGLY